MSTLDETSPERRIIELPQSTKLTEETIRQLDHFLEFARPQDVRNTLIEIYHLYIIHEHEMLPLDFKKMAEHLYFLITFLKIAEMEIKEGSQ